MLKTWIKNLIWNTEFGTLLLQLNVFGGTIIMYNVSGQYSEHKHTAKQDPKIILS